MNALKAKIKLSDAQRSLDAGIIKQEEFDEIKAGVAEILGLDTESEPETKVVTMPPKKEPAAKKEPAPKKESSKKKIEAAPVAASEAQTGGNNGAGE